MQYEVSASSKRKQRHKWFKGSAPQAFFRTEAAAFAKSSKDFATALKIFHPFIGKRHRSRNTIGKLDASQSSRINIPACCRLKP